MSADDTPKLDDVAQFDRAVGDALARWNHVEDHLGSIFCALLGGINNLAARAAYQAIINFNARLQMVNAAALASYLRPDLLDAWKSLHNRADKKSGIRNKLIHFSRARLKTSKGEWAIFLVPNFWTGDEWLAAIEGRGTQWTWPEISQFGQDFGTLAITLFQFSTQVEEHFRAQPPQYIPLTHGPLLGFDTPNDP